MVAIVLGQMRENEQYAAPCAQLLHERFAVSSSCTCKLLLGCGESAVNTIHFYTHNIVLYCIAVIVCLLQAICMAFLCMYLDDKHLTPTVQEIS